MRPGWIRALGVPFALMLVLPACDSGSPIGPTPPPCTFDVSPASLAVGSPGGTATVTVTTAGGCAWTSVSNAPWISIAGGASGTGPGTVTITVAVNPATGARTGTLTIAGQTVTVQEQGLASCTVEIEPDRAAFDHDGDDRSFSVIATDQCQWTAVSDASWLRVLSGQGTGDGIVTYRVERNVATTERAGAISVGGRSFRVTQGGDSSGCQYSVTPIEFTPCMPALTLTAALTTQNGCPWTAAPGAPWITVESAGSGRGSGVISFRVSENYDAPRQSVVEVRWPTPTAGQNLQVMQAGCLYAVSTGSIAIAAGGGPSQFNVIQQSVPITCGGPLQDACVWTAQSNVPWITIDTPMPQVGDDPVRFTVAPNPGPDARIGIITVRDKTVRVTQAGQ